jgi:hypothetical protein
MNIITLNKSNIVDTYYNNKLVYKTSLEIEANRYKISLFSFSIPYSIPNISSIYNKIVYCFFGCSGDFYY